MVLVWKRIFKENKVEKLEFFAVKTWTFWEVSKAEMAENAFNCGQIHNTVEKE